MAYNIGAFSLACCMIGLFFNTNATFGFVLATGIGFNLIVVYLVPYSMLPDCIEVDEMLTGRRREGIYVGFFGFLMKISVTLAMGCSNLLLKLTGYKAPSESCGEDTVAGGIAGEGEVLDEELPDDQNASTKLVIRFLGKSNPNTIRRYNTQNK